MLVIIVLALTKIISCFINTFFLEFLTFILTKDRISESAPNKNVIVQPQNNLLFICFRIPATSTDYDVLSSFHKVHKVSREQLLLQQPTVVTLHSWQIIKIPTSLNSSFNHPYSKWITIHSIMQNYLAPAKPKTTCFYCPIGITLFLFIQWVCVFFIAKNQCIINLSVCWAV